MSLFGKDTYATAQIDEETATSLPQPEGDLLSIRPSRSGPGLKKATGYVRDMHKVPRTRTSTPTYSFELWFEDGKIRLVCYAPDEQEVLDTLSGQFPDASAHDQHTPLPDISPGSYVSGGELVMSMDCIYPIKHLKSEDPFENDPYSSLLPKLAGRDDEHAVVQVVFQPVDETWYQRGLCGGGGDSIADSLKQGHVEGEINPRIVESDKDKDAARDVQAQRNKVSYRVAVRTLAVGDTPTVAEERAAAIGNIFDDYFNHVTGQGFTEIPVSGPDLQTYLSKMARREMPRQSRIKKFLMGTDRVLTVDQLGIVAHLPNADEVPSHNLDWSRMDSGPGVPADAPQPEFADDRGR